ncbi:hypothetical protein IW262DRAFT_1293645 [Armillaria fumosa]|nr:hypothetical protein IW262DRAFT_1293645 [Armillaria fumosa]
MDAYMDWQLNRDENKSLLVEEEGWTSEGIWVVDIFTILRCPQLSIQAFVQMLCDLHQYPTAGGLREQFSICYDVFIAILNNVELRVMKELGRSDPDWQLKNCCASCTFQLEDEENLEFSMFRAMDGNNSLKCILCSKTMGMTVDGKRISSEQDDSCDGGGEYILPRAEVDRWSKEAIGDMDMVEEANATPCEEQWKNMLDKHTSKMWGVFKETGFFLSLCHHGSVLIGADMVKSREQVKYPLAVVEKLLQVFGDCLGIGYDIGCKFGGTVRQSPLGELAETKQLRMLGLGLEDLETLEHFFSKSNALAGGIGYASCFHHCQRISWYLKHIDHSDSFEHLNIIDGHSALQKSMQELGINDEKVFEVWLREEETYLSNLQCEPLEEMVEMEYYARLVHYYDIESKVVASQRVAFINTTIETQLHTRDDTCKMEMVHRHLLEKLAQIFELTKMIMSHTGYKMQKHIGKALKVLSQAIQRALSQYNAAATALSPQGHHFNGNMSSRRMTRYEPPQVGHSSRPSSDGHALQDMSSKGRD